MFLVIYDIAMFRIFCALGGAFLLVDDRSGWLKMVESHCGVDIHECILSGVPFFFNGQVSENLD